MNGVVKLLDVITGAAIGKPSFPPSSLGCCEEDSEPYDGNEPYPPAVTSGLWRRARSDSEAIRRSVSHLMLLEDM